MVSDATDNSIQVTYLVAEATEIKTESCTKPKYVVVGYDASKLGFNGLTTARWAKSPTGRISG